MIGKIISLFLNAPKVVRIKAYPYFNRLLIKKVGGHLGNNIQIPGKLNLKIKEVSISGITSIFLLEIL